ncbi:MAG: DUF3038 domain-containing protein [Microcystis novacekii Mn_MB_F_20050700_S1]|uniref:DUF3038 domain-containing protein n=1 Tax=Microcystis novacekii Mn_MB_F_20050700_S1D TaxID=2486266 RepID=A0A552JA27_9CHRO|nr:MAG: DUF3038 domain-containing protein [Microcystis novacekii Mn_MB_F_20050700_S1]TRU92638.1 MAG: DUF3038 domain-containing protein [Microcystis novacekii Mn_MB_F_20050700_S1D]
MPQSAESPTSEDLPLAISPSNEQLENINSYLNLILVALVSLANLDSDYITQAAQELALDLDTSDRLASHYWQPQSKLSLADIRSLVLLLCHLAQKNQELIRRAVILLEQVGTQEQESVKTTLLGNYIAHFRLKYPEISENNLSNSSLTSLAWKLLIDLLFYSSPRSHLLLWHTVLANQK